MELDDLHRLSPVEHSPQNSSPAMAFSDIKQAREDTPAAAPTAAPPADSAGIYEKEEMIQAYRDTGQVVMTPYFYKGEKLELSALMTTMQELYTAFRQEITEFKTHQKDEMELAQFTEGLQLMNRVGRDYMRRFMSYGDVSYQWRIKVQQMWLQSWQYWS